VSNPTDALTARADAAAAFKSLFLSLGAIALVVGGIGIANVMLAVLERRGEIGLRPAMGARRVHVGLQFVCEAAFTSLAGGVIGAILGAIAVTAYAGLRHWGRPFRRPCSRAVSGSRSASARWAVSTRPGAPRASARRRRCDQPEVWSRARVC
jgi:hypothetical protein